MRAIRAIVLAFWATLLFNGPALAEKRVALVMGNSAYQNVNRLSNPGNDSSAMSETLKNAGFDVVELKRDLNVSEMRRALRDFSDTVRDADVAIVYFAGHGVEIDGTNYLIPVDAVLERDIDAFDEAIPLDRILTVIEPAKQLRLVILDACRDNPFNKTMKRTIGARAIGRGLAKVEPTSPNTLIAFAAKAGSTASDGDSKNSPFTAALVKYLTRPGLDLRKAFGFARDDVVKATNHKQEPFIYGSLGGDDVALVPAVAAPPRATSVADPSAAVRRDYEIALQIDEPSIWDSFIRNYPSGFYTDVAKARRNKLAAEEARVAATEKAKAAQEEQTRLAIEGAKAAEQAKAILQARAAEQARVAAELAKKDEEAKVAEAERAKAAALAKAADDARAADDKLKKADEAKAAEEAKLAAGKMKDDRPIGPIANLTPSDDAAPGSPDANQPALADIPRLLQAELRRVGCNTGAIDGNWDIAAQRSLSLFNKIAGMKLDVKVVSLEALDAVRSKTARICPLICDHGYKPDGERCVKITCKAGSFLNDDNTCEKNHDKPVATREEPITKRAPPQRKDVDHSMSQPPGTSQKTNNMFPLSCNKMSFGICY
ncbi:MAG: caspase family protein [Bradyrhizobium sp.]|nr:caspase family protein [Bradyrhizobium sp.]